MSVVEINAELFKSLLPMRAQNTYKGDFGTLLCIAGSRRYRGAAALAVLAASRCGVGMVKLASIEAVVSACAAQAPQCVFAVLEENTFGVISMNNAQACFDEAADSSAVLLGCGLGAENDIRILTSEMLRRCTKQLILDADALNVLAALGCELLKNAATPPILTPHIGEMAKLAGVSREAIKANPQEAARAYSVAYNSIIVLKDSTTIVASPSGDVFMLDSPNSGLSKAGSGDVLAGIIASLAAQGISPLHAAVCGVYIHSRAGRLCALRLSETAMNARDICDCIPEVFVEIGKQPTCR